jgi:hypothetical protein
MKEKLTKKELERQIDDLRDFIADADAYEYELHQLEKEYEKRFKKEYD